MKLFLQISLILLAGVLLLLPLTSCDRGNNVGPLIVGDDDGGGGGGGVTLTTITIAGAPTGTLNGGDLSDTISITYDLTNTDSVLTTLTAEFSVNGVVFDSMTEGLGSDGTSSLTSSPTGISHTFVWDSALNLPSSFGPRTNVVMRLTATAVGSSSSNFDTSSAFDVNNNLGVPTATVSTLDTSSGTILVSYTLSDVDGDLISIIPEFSTNDGGSFFSATQGSGGDGISALTPGAHTFAWQSAADISGTFTTVRFQIRPFDSEIGITGINPAAVTVDNTTAPVATLNTAGGGTLTGDAIISVTFTDTSPNSPTTANVEFSTNGGLSFSSCTPDGTSAFTSAINLFASLGTPLSFVWDTVADIPGTSGVVTGVIFRVTPIEGAIDGVPDSITVTVDNTGGGGGGFAFRASTDKWQINIAENDDADATADFIEGLTTANSGTNPGFGLDVPLATDTLLSQLNVYYRNNADGSAAAGGLDISFQTAAGTGTAPSPGNLQGSGFDSLDFSSIAIRNILHLSGESALTNPVGVAFFTSGGNTSIENNSQTGSFTDGPEELGVFVDRLNGFWNSTGFSPSQRTLSEYMKFLGQVTAHEIGHSLDFGHTVGSPTLPSPATNNIMSASSTIGPGIEFAFDNTLFTSAQSYMPGPSRCCNPMGMTPIQLLRASRSVVIGKRMNTQDPIGFQVLESLYGETLNRVIWIDGLSLQHPIYQLPEETLFIACLQPKGQEFQIVPGEDALFAISQTSEWIDTFQSYATLLNQKSSPAFHQLLLTQLQADLLSANEQIRLNAMYELMMARLIPLLNTESLQSVMNILSDETRSILERQTAVQILTLAANSEFGTPLQTLGLRAPKGLLQGIAGALETSLGTEQTTESLLTVLENCSEGEFHNAVTLLGWQRSRLATDRLLALVKQETREPIQIVLVDALGRIADPSALSSLQAAVRATGSVSLKKHLYRSIGQIGTDDAKMWLRQESYRNPDPSLNSTIQQSEKFAHTLEIR
ncbi:MAG: HEAT repeat domain-containing protein [Planctomycetota bacterium]